MADGWVVCAVCGRAIWKRDARDRDGKLFCSFCDPGDAPVEIKRKAPKGEFSKIDEMLDEMDEGGAK